MMIPYNRQFIDNQDIKFVSKILKSKNLTQGNMGNHFEKALKKKFKSKHSKKKKSNALNIITL